VAVIITLVATVGAIPRWSVIVLVILGSLFFSATALGLNWAKLRPLNFKSLGLFVIIWVFVGVLGFVVWPKENTVIGDKDGAVTKVGQLAGTETIRPHLQTQLVLDSVLGADIDFHIEVENISELQVNGLRAEMKTPEMTSIDVSSPLPPILPPGGRLSISGNPTSGLKKHGVLFLDLNYESNVDGRMNKFVSNYSFLVRPIDMKPQTILPATWQEGAGEILGPEQEVMEVSLRTLAGSAGTMLIALPLKRLDGSPNILIMRNNKKSFAFDGGSRSISFTTTTTKGTFETLKHSLPEGSYEGIVVGCLWDDQKDEAKLIISGKILP